MSDPFEILNQRYGPHQGLTADWNCRAWLVGLLAEAFVTSEIWILDEEHDDSCSVNIRHTSDVRDSEKPLHTLLAPFESPAKAADWCQTLALVASDKKESLKDFIHRRSAELIGEQQADHERLPFNQRVVNTDSVISRIAEELMDDWNYDDEGEAHEMVEEALA